MAKQKKSSTSHKKRRKPTKKEKIIMDKLGIKQPLTLEQKLDAALKDYLKS